MGVAVGGRAEGELRGNARGEGAYLRRLRLLRHLVEEVEGRGRGRGKLHLGIRGVGMSALRVGGREGGEEGVRVAVGLRGRHLHLDVDGLHPILAEAEITRKSR